MKHLKDVIKALTDIEYGYMNQAAHVTSEQVSHILSIESFNLSKDTAHLMFKVKSDKDAKVAIDMLVAFAGDRKGNWVCIPACRKSNDPLTQMGYIGFKCEKDGKDARTEMNIMIKHFGKGV